jgi:hypothetical protein
MNNKKISLSDLYTTIDKYYKQTGTLPDEIRVSASFICMLFGRISLDKLDTTGSVYLNTGYGNVLLTWNKEQFYSALEKVLVLIY